MGTRDTIRQRETVRLVRRGCLGRWCRTISYISRIAGAVPARCRTGTECLHGDCREIGGQAAAATDIARIVRQHSPISGAGGGAVLAQAWAAHPFVRDPADRERGRNDAFLQRKAMERERGFQQQQRLQADDQRDLRLKRRLDADRRLSRVFPAIQEFSRLSNGWSGRVLRLARSQAIEPVLKHLWGAPSEPA